MKSTKPTMMVEAEAPFNLSNWNKAATRLFGRMEKGEPFDIFCMGKGTDPLQKIELRNRLSFKELFEIQEILLYKVRLDKRAFHANITILPLGDEYNVVGDILIQIAFLTEVPEDYRFWAESRAGFAAYRSQIKHLEVGDKNTLEQQRANRINSLANGNSVVHAHREQDFQKNPFHGSKGHYLRMVKRSNQSESGKSIESIRVNNSTLVAEKSCRDRHGVMRVISSRELGTMVTKEDKEDMYDKLMRDKQRKLWENEEQAAFAKPNASTLADLTTLKETIERKTPKSL